MEDIMSNSMSNPEVVEEREEAIRQNYKVYKRRWPVLMAVFTITLMNGLQKSILPILDIFNNHMGMSVDNYTIMSQISLVVCLITVLPFARALEYYGLRRMAYFNCVAIVLAHSLKAICCFDNNFVMIVPQRYRFYVLLIAEIFVGLAMSISSSFPAKMAYDWFPIHESTRSLVLATVGNNVGAGFSVYFSPRYITNQAQIYKLGYVYIFSAMIMTLVVLLFIQRSRPKMPPSSSAIMSAQTNVPLSDGMLVMLNNPSFVLLLLTIALNTAGLQTIQSFLEDILNSQGYNDDFVGDLLFHSYMFGIFFLLIGAAWVDNSSNYVGVSRTSSLIFSLTFIFFCATLNFRNLQTWIIVSNLVVSLGISLCLPALTQVSLRCAATILPEATVSGLSVLLTQIAGTLLINTGSPLKSVSPSNDSYLSQLSFMALIVTISNVLYAISFKVPHREDLQHQISERISLRNPMEVLRSDMYDDEIA